ncbi:MAG TPA: hypothetical protein VMJ11_20175 [Paraburkholderia sp.]|uniref:hypothetical protein n=1 Tax=Paraburkholderia sp. TaxID=1926495 RepID=UPI002BA1670B|nr:hypothetical protein [Paraburkholderia sp.]HTR08921.1 hypothetical protein [Paraburkholderia sp.]
MKAEAREVHENQGRGMGPAGVPLMGELRKTNSHSPLEILPELYTANCEEGQLAAGESSFFLLQGQNESLQTLKN